MEIGKLVLLKDEHLPPSRWALGRIIETHPGSDGNIRVVTIKTEKGIFKRSIVKLCRLPVSTAHDTDAQQTENNIQANHTITEDQPLCEVSTTTKGAHKPKIYPINSAWLESAHKIPPCTALQRRLDRMADNATPSTTTTKRKAPPESSDAKRHKFLSPGLCLFLILLFLPLIAAQGTSEFVKITPFTSRPGLYFEEIGQVNIISNEWNLVIYYDLTNYWNEFNTLEQRVTEIQQLCTAPRSLIDRETCVPIVQQFQHLLTTIKNKNALIYLHNQHKVSRNKRSPLNIVGTGANKLFGILDQDFAAQYEENINQIRQNENHLLSLIRNQTSIEESTKNIIKKTNDEIYKQLSEFQGHLKTLTSKVNQLGAFDTTTRTFSFMVQHLTLNLINFSDMQSTILQVLIDAQHGKMNPHLLTPEQLENQKHIIQDNLPPNLRLPGDKEHGTFLLTYLLMTAQSRITQKSIIISAKMPLLNNEEFQLFHVISIPTPHDNTFLYIQVNTKFLAANVHRDRYYPIQEMELNQCQLIHDTQYLCRQQHPIYNRASTTSRCELDLLTHQKLLSPYCVIKAEAPAPFWTQLHTPNSWIFVLNEEHTVDIICGKTIITKTLKNDGILRIQDNCLIKEPTMTIHSHNIFSGSLAASVTPSTNLSEQFYMMFNKQNTSIPTPKLILHNQTDVSELEIKINDLKAQQELPQRIDHHHVHHYAIIYFAILF